MVVSVPRADSSKRDLEVVAQVGPPLRAAAPALPAEQVAEPEDVPEPAEHVAEVGEDGRVEARRRLRPTRSRPRGRSGRTGSRFCGSASTA